MPENLEIMVGRLYQSVCDIFKTEIPPLLLVIGALYIMFESEVRRIFQDHSYLLNDVAGVKYPKGEKVDGFHHRSIHACDNIVLWVLCHDTNQREAVGKHGTTVGFAMATVREILGKCIESPNIKFIGRGRDRTSDDVREAVHARKRESLRMATGYIPGYIAVKVSLSDMDLEDVHRMLFPAIRELEESYIILHDIDVFVDCGGITNRGIVQEYLLENGISMQSIVNDRVRVGDDCISWMVKNRRRNKVYNKYIQMLQSCDVRKAVGSIIADLIHNPDDKFTDKLLRYREIGMSRVETTFYSSELRSVEYYTNKMDELLDFLGECPVYYASFDKQWKRLLREVESSFAMYITNKKIFAYSHWWNSITGKIQGYSRGKVAKSEVEKLLSNYSFNDRPMYFVQGSLKDGEFVIKKERTYRRDEDSQVMTLVPGVKRGLYPSFHGLEGNTLSFEDVGIVTYRDITIGWPTRTLRKDSRSLVDVTWEKGIPTEDEIANPSQDEPVDKNVLREVNISSTGRYKSANVLPKDGPKKYTIVKYGRREFHGSLVTHVITKDGVKIRCTNNLQLLVEEQIPNGVHFQVELTRAIKVRGYRDVHCRLVRE